MSERPKSTQASWNELFIVETETGEWEDANGEGGWSCFSSIAEAQDAADNCEEPHTIVKFVRVAPSRSAAPNKVQAVGAEEASPSTDGCSLHPLQPEQFSASAAPPSEREALIAELKAARTAWHEKNGVPISFEYARFLDAIGDLTDWMEGKCRTS